jgi:hypothetical protein
MDGLMDLTELINGPNGIDIEEQFYESVYKTGFVEGKPVQGLKIMWWGGG